MCVCVCVCVCVCYKSVNRFICIFKCMYVFIWYQSAREQVLDLYNRSVDNCEPDPAYWGESGEEMMFLLAFKSCWFCFSLLHSMNNLNIYTFDKLVKYWKQQQQQIHYRNWTLKQRCHLCPLSWHFLSSVIFIQGRVSFLPMLHH